MSTLEVACGRCEKKFRVRVEFAGRSTRCPGCSAPIAIAGAPAKLPPARQVEEERPRSRPRSRDDDNEPQRPTLNWVPVETAFRREQLAVVFALLSVLGGFLAACAGNMGRGASGEFAGVFIFVTLLFGIGPSLGTTAFGIMARVSALGAPRECLARGSTVASLLSSIAALLCLVILAMTMMMSMDAQRPDPLPMIVALGGLVLSGLTSLVTFLGFIAQVGIYRRSAEVSRAVGRTATAAAVCVLVLIVIGILYAMANALIEPSYSRGGYGRTYYQPDHSGFFVILLGILMPIALGVVVIFYHRLLAAGRRSLEAGG